VTGAADKRDQRAQQRLHEEWENRPAAIQEGQLYVEPRALAAKQSQAWRRRFRGAREHWVVATMA